MADQSGIKIEISYLRFLGAYEGDIEVEPGKYVHSFLLHCETVEGTRYICPVFCPDDGSLDKARGGLQVLVPLVFAAFNDGQIKDTGKKEMTTIVEHLYDNSESNRH